MKNKIRVAVLYGGRSGEHEISLVSAANVIQNLDRTRFEVVPIGIDKQGAWYLGDDNFKAQLSRDANRMLFNPDFIGKNIQNLTAVKLPERQTGERIFDVVFPVIHGTLCEDGTVQGLLELADVPYVGCGVLASAVGMDKDVSKRLIKSAGLNVPPFMTVKKAVWEQNQKLFCETIKKNLQFPIFVKPANTGSSVGIQKVKRAEDIIPAVEFAFQYDTKVIVEQGIDAMELELAVLESEAGQNAFVSVVGQIKPTSAHEFYSYAAKYLDENGAELIIPAPISPQLQTEIQHTARHIFNELDCEGMARVDLFLEKQTNKIYFNEINTIPGFTQISMYPKLLAASGINYSELLTRLVMLAIARHQRKSKLKRDYADER